MLPHTPVFQIANNGWKSDFRQVLAHTLLALKTPVFLLKKSFLLICFIMPSIALAEPLKIVAFGDSTTAPRTKVETYSEVLGKHFGPKIEILNKGIPANTTAKAANRFKRDVLDQQPDVVIIQFGINDSAIDVWQDPPKTEPRVAMADYVANLRNFVKESQAAGAKVILMTPNQLRWTPALVERYGRPPYDTNDERGFSLILTSYAEAVRTLAREEGTGLVDVFSLYDTWEKENGKSCSELMLDGMHPNSQGQALVAKALAEQIESLHPETKP